MIPCQPGFLYHNSPLSSKIYQGNLHSNSAITKRPGCDQKWAQDNRRTAPTIKTVAPPSTAAFIGWRQGVVTQDVSRPRGMGHNFYAAVEDGAIKYA